MISKKYITITKSKISQETSLSKIGDIWVSFYLDEIVTIRDRDWEKLASYFSIPENIKDVDFEKIKLNKQGELVKYEKNMALPLFDQTATNSR